MLAQANKLHIINKVRVLETRQFKVTWDYIYKNESTFAKFNMSLGRIYH